jgi:hypothetical protein
MVEYARLRSSFAEVEYSRRKASERRLLAAPEEIRGRASGREGSDEVWSEGEEGGGGSESSVSRRFFRYSAVL